MLAAMLEAINNMHLARVSAFSSGLATKAVVISR